MKTIYKILLLLLFSSAIPKLSLAQTVAAINPQETETYPWMLNIKWSIYNTDNWLVKTSIEDLVKADYSSFQLLDHWNTGELVTVLGLDISISRRDRKSKSTITKQFHLTDNNLLPALPEIEKCGDTGDQIRFDNITITVDGKTFRVKGFYIFEFR